MRPGTKVNDMNKKAQSESRFRFPFDIDARYFLALSIVFLILSVKRVNEKILPPLSLQTLGKQIEGDLDRQLQSADALADEQDLIRSALNQKLSVSQVDSLVSLPYAVFIYRQQELRFWNETHHGNPAPRFPDKTPVPFQNRNGYYIAYQRDLPGSDRIHLLFLCKVKNDFGVRNRYLTKNFLVSDRENDFNIELLMQSKPGAVPLTLRGAVQYYLHQNNNNQTVIDQNGWRLAFRALFFLLFGLSIHTFGKILAKKRKGLAVYFFLLFTIIAIRSATYIFGFPNNLREFSLFSPEYFSVDIINRSLGDLFVNMCLIFWMLLFFIMNVQTKVVLKNQASGRFRVGLLVFVLATFTMMYQANVVHQLITESIIQFDTTLFYKLDIFSFIGLLTCMVVFVNIVCISVIARHYFLQSFGNRYVKYVLLVLSCGGFVLLPIGHWEAKVIAHFLFAFLYFLQDLNMLKTKIDFSSYKLLIWILFISASGALCLTLLIEQREWETRERYGRQLLGGDEKMVAERLRESAGALETDSVLFSMAERMPILSDSVKDYLHHQIVFSTGVDFETEIRWLPTDSVYGRQVQFCRDNDWGPIALRNTGNCYRMFLCLQPTGLPKQCLEIRLFQSLSAIRDEHAAEWLLHNYSHQANNDVYSYAVYQGNTLYERKGKHLFPYRLNPRSQHWETAGRYVHFADNATELWLQNQTGDAQVVVVKEKNSVVLFTTLFAYIFLVYFLAITLYILGNILAKSNFNSQRFLHLLGLTLRLRIQMVILLVELISFIVIGYFTSYYLIRQANERMKNDLNNSSYMIQKDIRLQTWQGRSGNLQEVSLSATGSALVQKISERLSLDLNLYSITDGKLLYSSQPALYKRDILSQRIDPYVFYSLRQGESSSMIHEEHIGLLPYLSSYFLIRNAGGQEIGIVQLPFFQSNDELRSEGTTIITTLITIYIFVFLFSALIAYLLTRSVTRPFAYILKQFTQINLTKSNEPLQWIDNDEIGLLVKEYNRMVRKLENSTLQLAKTEREMAWREMAKQVAHEIKNPLTPMKLSLQMLERAIQMKSTNVEEIAMRVSKTLVEQIDNLSIIASNFSDFAKLPISNKEIFLLNDVLRAVTGMYHNDQSNDFLFVIPEYDISLFADKSQIIRVFTNIIQNAIQSIPEDRKGKIALTVTRVSERNVRIAIADNGIGITEEKADSLFVPYFTTKSSGSGLGLAMCKDIIEESGGRIAFSSKPRQGTVFYIDLPVYASGDAE